jgi:hypothetical protein
MIDRRRVCRPRPLRRQYVLTGLDPYAASDSVRNMAGYDEAPPALRRRIANNPHPMVFARTPDGKIILVEMRG